MGSPDKGNVSADAKELFRHVSAEKAAVYRSILDAFAGAKRQFRLHMRPDEVLAEGEWAGNAPSVEEVQAALAQLTEWGNLQSQPDTARVGSLSDFYRARYLYRLSQGGEAVEAAMEVFIRSVKRRAELQTVALEDIANRLQTLKKLAAEPTPDDAMVHETLRDLVRVFEGLAENAQAFMAGISRSLELQQADATAVAGYKKRLIDYLDRFIGDLVSRSGMIALRIRELQPLIIPLLAQAAAREARDAAPGSDEQDHAEYLSAANYAWQERWKGLQGWFIQSGHSQPQSELLRSKARSAIPQLLTAIAAINERRSGRSDRSADFRVLASWFANCADDQQSHRLARAAFALNPARHFSLNTNATDVPATTPWSEAPPLQIHPRLREYGEATPRGPLARVKDRNEERELLARQATEEQQQIEAARARFAHGNPLRLSELGQLDPHAFRLFLSLLGEALTSQHSPEHSVERQTGDGLLRLHLQPLGADTQAEIRTDAGTFRGRDHLLTVTSTEETSS
jgi:uncharacterized protein (TIGR02677 family)